VKVGDKIAAGAAIGAVGSTGRSTGPHLHFEVRRDGKAVDPKPYLEAASPPAAASDETDRNSGATPLHRRD
jgi:murein DD-endopeptidase MepM/ murein hydrolase activator NlpD